MKVIPSDLMYEFVPLLAEMVTWTCELPVKDCVSVSLASSIVPEQDPKIQEHLLSKA